MQDYDGDRDEQDDAYADDGGDDDASIVSRFIEDCGEDHDDDDDDDNDDIDDAG